MPRLPFSVDANLLRELGERLVGRPHIALAELIKNSYDADATVVEVTFEPDRIVVADNGSGMTLDDFRDKWMRIGTNYKASIRETPRFHRELTGSKGVGRLAAQVLAHEISIRTVPVRDSQTELTAHLDWDSAVSSESVTKVLVDVNMGLASGRFPDSSNHGTEIELTRLATDWSADDFRSLAQEVWSLQPPADGPDSFRIELNTEFREAYDEFDAQMRAILSIWNWRITGKLLDLGSRPPPDATVGVLPSTLPRDGDAVDVDTESGSPDRYLEVQIQSAAGDVRRTLFWRVPHCELSRLRFDVRVFDLQNRQPAGIKVDVARSYLRRFGGVGIYDGDFRLPYYGPDVDWLSIESDVAARLTASALLPEGMNVRRGLLSLPRNANLFGQAFVSTTHEEREARRGALLNAPLSIQVTRDRLVDNAAYQRVRVMLRAALDAYAMERAREVARRVRVDVSRTLPSKQETAVSSLREVLSAASDYLPEPTVDQALGLLREIEAESKRSDRNNLNFAAILGALATFGITSLAYEHELSKQVTRLEDAQADLLRLAGSQDAATKAKLHSIGSELEMWIDRASSIRSVFSALVDEEDRTTFRSFAALPVMRDIAGQVEVLAPRVRIDLRGISPDLVLPEANLPAWTAVFQNLFINAFNATLDEPDPKVQAFSRRDRGSRSIQVENNGLVVDVKDSERLWQPFERGEQPAQSPDQILGGTGLGLTIVRMVARQVGVVAEFVEPTNGMSTAIRLSWKV